MPNISNQAKLSKQTFKKLPIELQYVKTSVFMKEVTTQNVWSFKLGTEEGTNISIWIFIGFQQRDMQDSLNLGNDTFH